MPRPRTRVGNHEYPVIEALASVGSSRATIASRIGMSVTTFRKVLERDPKTKEAFERGRGQMKTELVKSLFETAMDRTKQKSVTAAIALLKMVHQMSDQPQPQSTENKVSIEFKLPGALSETAYKQLVDVTPKKALKEAGVEDNGS